MGHLKFKLNADGSSLDNPGRIGAVALIRDHNGNWVIDAYRHIRRAASVEVELWAFREIEADATPSKPNITTKSRGPIRKMNNLEAVTPDM
ncbi:hypothetical protein GOBAR_DD16600 [Gossypium barbadense]|nr:hypothetical protein GOBAR_DD16600 [Gossypium barbadense]